MNQSPVILLIGTVDTKSDEIAYLRESIRQCGGQALVMDVGVQGHGTFRADIPNTEVAAAAGLTLAQVMASGDENSAMQLMAQGASLLALQGHLSGHLQGHPQGRFDGMLAIGGSMGTDLALQVANALPLGCPKLVLSTIAHSHLIPPERIAPDLMMRLWAGGLYGLNRLCRQALGQAAGAVVGACLAAKIQAHAQGQGQGSHPRPVIGMTSLGSSALHYMRHLKPAVEARGYELAVFHTTGMGGRAFEDLAAKGLFAAVMDFSLQELVNDMAGSCVSAGPDRLLGAGRAGVPQIVAPGATDMVDFPAWGSPPARWSDRPVHIHNRLIASVCIDVAMRREVARSIAQRLGQATGAVSLLLPMQGIEAWDRPGQPMHDPEGLAALVDELPRAAQANTRVIAIDAHINDPAFADAALQVLDSWVQSGIVPRGVA